MVRVTGPSCSSCRRSSSQDWFLETGQADRVRPTFPDPEITGNVPAQVLPASPLFAAATTSG